MVMTFCRNALNFKALDSVSALRLKRLRVTANGWGVAPKKTNFPKATSLSRKSVSNVNSRHGQFFSFPLLTSPHIDVPMSLPVEHLSFAFSWTNRAFVASSSSQAVANFPNKPEQSTQVRPKLQEPTGE
eukprot:2688177-Amphidinium_carterae.1